MHPLSDGRISAQASVALAADAKAAALRGGGIALEGFRKQVRVVGKGSDYDIVTRYDRLSEEAITEYLLTEHPEAAVLGEEAGQSGDGDLVWFVDPIDGTKNFASGLPLFCVSVGAAYRGSMVAAAVYDPVHDDLYSASLGGAFLNGEPLRSHGSELPCESVVLIDGPDEGPEYPPTHQEILIDCLREFRAVRRIGSCALELAYVASGRADVQVGLDIHPWDVAAGMFILRQSGGHYEVPADAASGGQPEWESPVFLAYTANFRIRRSRLRSRILGVHGSP
ncbi:myo-inositol-1(or 4)-monophosphatase [Spinactinospora alkalitolerans]|uniref:Inositol-1-monophosphatase n=1 Tax=Spinactinospora alkalitolerans TaxID=687207 RepID=A0A852TYW4_9ACTN|nr:inositol monophosphatase family protein [Spinactinospora alkalitolerans]NYE47983.1 myo-inositol-1(or 4)-monophosphatase [Spinactinospora alkalitolerans]